MFAVLGRHHMHTRLGLEERCEGPERLKDLESEK